MREALELWKEKLADDIYLILSGWMIVKSQAS
jgi:hypothetical protein